MKRSPPPFSMSCLDFTGHLLRMRAPEFCASQRFCGISWAEDSSEVSNRPRVCMQGRIDSGGLCFVGIGFGLTCENDCRHFGAQIIIRPWETKVCLKGVVERLEVFWPVKYSCSLIRNRESLS